MPARDAGPTVCRALESVLEQTFGDVEVVVVEDGSTDDTLDVVRATGDERVRVIVHDRPLGLVHSLHDGIRHATGDCIARMDADDVSRPTRFERQLERLRDPDVGLVATSWEACRDDGSSLGVRRTPGSTAEARFRLAFGNCLAHSSVMFRRSAYEAAGGYRPRDFPAEDYGLWARMLGNVGFAGVDSVELVHHTHATSVSTRHAAEQRTATLALSGRAIEDLVGRTVPAEILSVLAGYEEARPEHVAVAVATVVDVFEAVRREAGPDRVAKERLDGALAVMLRRAGVTSDGSRSAVSRVALTHPAIVLRLLRRGVTRRFGGRPSVDGPA